MKQILLIPDHPTVHKSSTMQIYEYFRYFENRIKMQGCQANYIKLNAT